MLGDLPTARIKEIISLCDQFNDAIEKKFYNDKNLQTAVKGCLSAEEKEGLAEYEAHVASMRSDYHCNAQEYDEDLLTLIVMKTANNMGLASRVLSAQDIQPFIPSDLKDEDVVRFFEDATNTNPDDPDLKPVMDLLL